MKTKRFAYSKNINKKSKASKASDYIVVIPTYNRSVQ